MVAAWRHRDGTAAEPAVRRARPESVGRLLPHRADRMEPADGRAAAGPDRRGHRDGDAARAKDSAERHGGLGRHQRRGIGFPAPRRARLSAAGLVRHQPAAEAADGDDDRRRVQHACGLAAHRPGDQDDRRLRGRPPRIRSCPGLRRSRRRLQQRHRVRQRQPRKQRRSPDQRCCPVHGLASSVSAPTRPNGASSDGRWAARAPSTSQ